MISATSLVARKVEPRWVAPSANGWAVPATILASESRQFANARQFPDGA